MSRIKTMLNKVTDIQPLLEKLKSGQVIRRTLSIFFRVVAALMGLGCLVFWLTSWLFIGEL